MSVLLFESLELKGGAPANLVRPGLIMPTGGVGSRDSYVATYVVSVQNVEQRLAYARRLDDDT